MPTSDTTTVTCGILIDEGEQSVCVGMSVHVATGGGYTIESVEAVEAVEAVQNAELSELVEVTDVSVSAPSVTNDDTDDVNKNRTVDIGSDVEAGADIVNSLLRTVLRVLSISVMTISGLCIFTTGYEMLRRESLTDASFHV